MNRMNHPMERHMPRFRKPPIALAWVVGLTCVLACASPLTAQTPMGPALDLGSAVEQLQQVLAPTPTPAPAEALPPPQEHFIPVRNDVAPGAIEVENLDGAVRLVVRDAPLRQVLALLAESQKLNLVFSSVSEATVTVSLDQVPLATALDAILSSCGHTWTQRGNIIHVTEVAEGLAIAPGAQGRRLEVFELDYAAAADIDLAVKGLLSPLGKSWVTQSSRSDNRRTREVITVEDLPEYVDRIAAYIAQADQAPRQVLVEVQILEVELSDERAHGVNFHKLADVSGSGIRFATTGFDSSSPTTSSPESPQTFFFSIHGGDFSALVQLLQSTTDAKTLASPKLLAVNGQESHIQIGEKLPYRLTTTTQTSTQESVQFLDVGVVLRFTPWITRDGRVLLRVAPKVSQGAVNPNTGLPEEATTEVETDAFLADGEGVVIGGLIRQTDTVDQSKVPVLGDIPYAGALFQRRAADRKRSEVIIALMPHLVPYSPDMQCQQDLEVQRARDPLVHGPLCRFPRPYEPRLPDITGEACLPWRARLGYECDLDGQCSRLPACTSTVAIRRLPPCPDTPQVAAQPQSGSATR